MNQPVACENGRPNAALERLQACQKAILAEVLDFCRTHELPCVLAAGSALGCARHGEMIPWDDDIDIAMMRGDLARFEALWMRHYRGHLRLHSPRTEGSYPLDYIKIRQPATAMHEPELVGSGMVDGIYLDIFAFDVLPHSAVARRVQRLGLALLNLVIMSYSEHTTRVSGSGLVRGLRRVSLAMRGLLPWRRLIPFREWLSALGYPHPDGQIICFEMYGIGQARRTIIPADKVFPPVHASFGDLDAPMPRDADAYLTGLFGDWRKLPPPEMRQPLHARMVDFGD